MVRQIIVVAAFAILISRAVGAIAADAPVQPQRASEAATNKAPNMSYRPDQDDAKMGDWPHSCYGDRFEKDEDLNAFYPITDEEIFMLLGNGPGA